MSVLRNVARPMLASIFVAQGLETLRHPQEVAPLAEPVVRRIADKVPAVPAETEQAVRLNGAIQLAAGTMLGLGWLPRLSAVAIAGTLVPTTLAGHRFWEIEDPQERAQQRIHFLKNVTMLGGLLIAAADTAGSPSLSWRREHAARKASRNLSGITQAVSDAAAAVSDSARTAGGHLSGVSAAVSDSARTAGAHLSDAAASVSDSARAAGEQLPAVSRAAADTARTAAGQLTQVAADSARAAGGYLADAAQAAATSARAGGEQLPQLSRAAADSAAAAADEITQVAQVAADQVTQAAQAALSAGRRKVRQLAS
jgi:putative oxidoreductase